MLPAFSTIKFSSNFRFAKHYDDYYYYYYYYYDYDDDGDDDGGSGCGGHDVV